jgi:DNA mismatch repair protein PMS2
MQNLLIQMRAHTGIAPANYEKLTMKHYTSKLTDFSDLTTVATFGFRGEALSSLCALANLTVLTTHGDEDHGTEVKYGHSGEVESTGACAHKLGTTVRLDNLFKEWPVRYREMRRNIKKEFGKLVLLLQAYCLVRPDVRITCVNVTAKGSKTTVLSSPGRKDLRSVITVLFGGKQLQVLSPYVAAPPPPPDAADADGVAVATPLRGATKSITITGYISKAKPECGRASGDRQFLSINSRPCDLAKVTKTINEVYHQCVCHSVCHSLHDHPRLHICGASMNQSASFHHVLVCCHQGILTAIPQLASTSNCA